MPLRSRFTGTDPIRRPAAAMKIGESDHRTAVESAVTTPTACPAGAVIPVMSDGPARSVHFAPVELPGKPRREPAGTQLGAQGAELVEHTRHDEALPSPKPL